MKMRKVENMAAPIKRTHDGLCMQESNAKLSTVQIKEEALGNFVAWCSARNFNFSKKVKVSRNGSCAQYGMVATEDISEEECLFQIPREYLLSPETSSISKHLAQYPINCSSNWVPLLVTLMYEYNKPESPWRPYLDLVPDFSELDLPMFWSESDRLDLLKGTGVVEAVKRDEENIKKEFNEVVLPYVSKYPNIFGPVCQSIEFYKKMVAFVMAYSFTEPSSGVTDDDEDEDEDDDDGEDEKSSPPMMVPMADILNHIAKNNARLCFEKDALKMMSCKKIKKGEEIFNTYGELANWHLLHMYGFAEEYPNNHYDTVDVPYSCVLEAAMTVQSTDEQTLVQEKWNFLSDIEVIEENGSFIVGVDSILTDEEMCEILKVLAMDKQMFSDYKENEGWSDDEDTDETRICDLSSYESIKKAPAKWKQILSKSAELCMKRYSSTLEENTRALKATAQQTMNTRSRYALHTCHGQKQLLKKLIDSCS